MLKSYFASVIFICYLFILDSNAWRPYEIKIINQTSSSMHRNVFVNSTLNADGSFDMNAELLQTFSDVYLHSEVYFDSGVGKFELELINRTINVCRFLRDARYEPILQIVYKIILQYGNFPKKCPFQKNKYYITRLLLNTEMYPPVLPEKKGFFQVTFLNKSQISLSRFSSYFIIEKKYKPKQYNQHLYTVALS